MKRLADRKDCTGCFACLQKCEKQAIKKTLGNDGFYYPEIVNEICVNCGKCSQACPLINKEKDDIQYHSILAANSVNDNILEHSSSGGVFSELAEAVINMGGRVYGAAYRENFTIKHISITKISEIGKLQGAKYAQSDLQNSFVEIERYLKQGQVILFSGTPCQVGGLKTFLGKEYSNLICVDFICHGIPSPAVWERYLEYRKNTDSDHSSIGTIVMRSKVSGWVNYKYSSVYSYESGHNKVLKNGEEPFMTLFLKEKINRLSCSNCQFKTKRYSDLTIGDCWGIWDIQTELEISKGVSLIIINSEKGKTLLDTIKQKLNTADMNQYSFEKYNPAYIKSFSPDIDREYIIKRILQGDNSYFDNPNQITFMQKLNRHFRSKADIASSGGKI